MNPYWFATLFLLVGSLVTFFDDALYFRNIETTRNEAQVQYAINSASDLSVQLMRKTYQETQAGNDLISPDYIWKTYKYAFLQSNNIYSDHNMQVVESNFPAVLITVNDGYYLRVLTPETVGTKTEYNYRFLQKLPFARTTLIDTETTSNTNNISLAQGVPPNIIPAGTVVSDTMDGKNIVAYKEGLIGDGEKKEYQVYQQEGVSLSTRQGSAHDLIDINRQILQALDYTMYFNASVGQPGKKGASLSIPDTVSDDLLSQSVSFVGPTVFAFSDNITVTGGSYRNHYSVGAAQIVDAEKFYTYIRGGNKYYSRLNPELRTGSEYSSIIQYYSSPTEAAQSGFRPDPYYY